MLAVPALASAPTASGGVVLDGWGGLHPFGGVQLNTTGAPYWSGWDMARSLALMPDGQGGWELDGWGGIHAFGVAPQITDGPYWPRWDVARALVVDPDQQSGYVLDAFGGLHEFGGAPQLTGNPYWQGWPIARGLSIHYSQTGSPDGGWTLDAWGGIHAFGAAPPLASAHQYTGLDFWRSLHVTGNGTGAFMTGTWGIVDSDGSTPGISWVGYPTWGSWAIARDVVPVNPTGAWQSAPVDRGAASALVTELNNLDRVNRGLRPLAFDSRLAALAGNGDTYNLHGCGGSGTIADRSRDMLIRNYFQHAIPGCSSTNYVWQTYYASYGVSYRTAGENIGWDSLPDVADSAWAINTAWLNSPEHLANLTNTNFSAIGCGGFSGSGYQGQMGLVWVWTCDFRG